MKIRIDSIFNDIKELMVDLEYEINKLTKENQELNWKIKKYEKLK